MMQLLCNNVVLDLPQSADVQFTHDNPLFAFDNLKCERTTQFKLPSTPTNDNVLGLARVPAYTGDGMRRKFDATLIMGTIIKNGYLYVSSFDGGNYSAVFVTGELVGLQRLKELGTARNVLQYDSAIAWTGSGVAANSDSIQNVDIVKHVTENGGVVSPSVSLKWLIDEMAASTGVSVQWSEATGAEKLRIVQANKAKIEDTKVHLIRTYTDKESQDPSANVNSLLGIITADAHTGAKWIAQVQHDPYEGYYIDDPVTNFIVRGQFDNWLCPYDISIKFGDDLQDDFFLISGDAAYRQEGVQSAYWADCVFLGGWSFNRTHGYNVGTPLKGRKVEIPANTPFALVKKSDFDFPDLTQTGNTNVGFDFANAAEYDIEVTLSCEHDFKQGDLTPYNAIIPDLTIVKLLQLAAACTGTLLDYDGGVIKLAQAIPSTWSIEEISDIVKEGEIKRVFADYAQNNYIKFKDDDNVYGFEKILLDYTIDNENIEASKELQKLEASEGGIFVLYRSVDDMLVTDEGFLVRGDKDRVMIARTGAYENMLRVELPKNSCINLLCQKSTQIKVTARMGALLYDKIKSSTAILLRGTLYAWTSRSWQKGEAQFTLAKFS